jgi:hypothetical protein
MKYEITGLAAPLRSQPTLGLLMYRSDFILTKKGRRQEAEGRRKEKNKNFSRGFKAHEKKKKFDSTDDNRLLNQTTATNPTFL